MADLINEDDIDKDFYKAMSSHNLIRQRLKEFYEEIYDNVKKINSYDFFDTKYGSHEEIDFYKAKIMEEFEDINHLYLNYVDKDILYDYDFSALQFAVNNLSNYTKKLLEQKDNSALDSLQDIKRSLKNFYIILNSPIEKSKKINEVIEKLEQDSDKLNKKIEVVQILSEDLKNKKVHEIFEDDSEKFKNLARKYEVAFYLALVFLFLYFFGWYIEIDTSFLKFKFAEQFHGNHSATFYVQKISLLILSTTLAAFLLKRSFMNRRLADEAYRTAKELNALPRYMEGMPDEMKEKIRFDLAYKYFGNGIHHDSYTGGENLMHENIKANTEFVKVLKGEPSTTDETKASKDKNE